MRTRRPPCIIFTVCFECLLGCVWLLRLGELSAPLIKLVLLSVAVGNFYSAFGLYNMTEWGRQRSIQFAVFDLLGTVQQIFGGQVSALGALIQMGMPVYMLSALNDSDIKNQFS